MSKIKRAACLMLSVLTLATMFSNTCIAATTTATVTTTTQTDLLTTQSDKTQSDTDYSIVDYLDKYKSVPITDQLITLDTKDITNKESIKSDYEGKQNIAVMNESSSIDWTFNVPETALYALNLQYFTMPGNSDFLMSMKVDGTILYNEANNISLKRVWMDSTKITQDSRGNDIKPNQKEVNEWISGWLTDNVGFHNGPLQIYLSAGKHTIQLNNLREAIAIKQLLLTFTDVVPTSDAVKAEYIQKGYTATQNIFLKQQAEVAYQKSDQSIAPDFDRTSPVTEPSDPSNLKLNVIWFSSPGSWVSYKMTVPEDGLYNVDIKYRQSMGIGMTSLRDVYVDDKIPSTAFKNVEFKYNVNWQIKTVSDAQGNACPVYLTKGPHIIKFQSTIGKWSPVLEVVDQVNKDLSNLYRNIIMITGTNPDVNRDYYLDKEIPNLISTLKKDADTLEQQAAKYDQLFGGKSMEAEKVRAVVLEMRNMISAPDTIPTRLVSFRSNISVISSWITENKNQDLQMDYFALSSSNVKLPSAVAPFFQKLVFGIEAFIGSFFLDYNSISDANTNTKSIKVWVYLGREQADIIKSLIDDEFTAKTNIHVNLSLVYGGLIEAKLAGTNPDVVINVPRSQPVNMAFRGALADLSKFDTYKDVTTRFINGAMLPYQYNGGTYGIPMTQSFFMMFYRTDIFKQLAINPPQTWDDFYKVIPVLQRNNMEIYLPYAGISSTDAINAGLGSKDIFASLLMQNGGSFYNSTNTKSGLDQPQAITAFKMWVDFYAKYGFPLSMDFNSRFRTGEVPLGIASFEFYTMLSVAAPEIRNEWAMVPMPGTKKADGTIDRTVGDGGAASIMFENAKNPAECWKFLDWWSSEEAQYQYGLQVENKMGTASRYMSANVNAFNRMPWTASELKVISAQRKFVKEIPEIPGNYLVIRCIDNAFRSVIYEGKNARDALEIQNTNINQEITRKRIEIGLNK
jgi:ABC-type glycerol-3-phosphate transport system substrate-binding protein